MELLPEECQLLPPTHQQERDKDVLKLEVETLYLLAARGGRGARKIMQDSGAYIVVRELHLQNEDEVIREWCEKVVDLLLGEDGAGHGKDDVRSDENRITEVMDEGDEDDEIVPIF